MYKNLYNTVPLLNAATTTTASPPSYRVFETEVPSYTFTQNKQLAQSGLPRFPTRVQDQRDTSASPSKRNVSCPAALHTGRTPSRLLPDFNNLLPDNAVNVQRPPRSLSFALQDELRELPDAARHSRSEDHMEQEHNSNIRPTPIDSPDDLHLARTTPDRQPDHFVSGRVPYTTDPDNYNSPRSPINVRPDSSQNARTHDNHSSHPGPDMHRAARNYDYRSRDDTNPTRTQPDRPNNSY